MNEYLEYVTKDGQRWDQISYELYGSAFEYGDLIALNPQNGQQATLPGGVVLQVPIAADATATAAIPPSLLPPWKR